MLALLANEVSISHLPFRNTGILGYSDSNSCKTHSFRAISHRKIILSPSDGASPRTEFSPAREKDNILK